MSFRKSKTPIRKSPQTPVIRASSSSWDFKSLYRIFFGLLIGLQIVRVDSVISGEVFQKLNARIGIEVKPLTIAHHSTYLSPLPGYLPKEHQTEHALYKDTHQTWYPGRPYNPYSSSTLDRLSKFRNNSQAVWDKVTKLVENSLENDVIRRAVNQVRIEFKADSEQMPNTPGNALAPTSHAIFYGLTTPQLDPGNLSVETTRDLCYLAIFETLRHASRLDAPSFLEELMAIAVLTNRMRGDETRDLDVSIAEVISLFGYMIRSTSNAHFIPTEVVSSGTDSYPVPLPPPAVDIYQGYILTAYDKIISDGKLLGKLKERVRQIGEPSVSNGPYVGITAIMVFVCMFLYVVVTRRRSSSVIDPNNIASTSYVENSNSATPGQQRTIEQSRQADSDIKIIDSVAKTIIDKASYVHIVRKSGKKTNIQFIKDLTQLSPPDEVEESVSTRDILNSLAKKYARQISGFRSDEIGIFETLANTRISQVGWIHRRN
jgi:hypothetical protein